MSEICVLTSITNGPPHLHISEDFVVSRGAVRRDALAVEIFHPVGRPGDGCRGQQKSECALHREDDGAVLDVWRATDG